MGFDAELAAIRFGTGLSPRIPPPRSRAAMIEALAGPDHAARRFPIAGLAALQPSQVAFRDAVRALRGQPEGPERERRREVVRGLQRETRSVAGRQFIATLSRGITAQDGLRERLTAFWADHFTVRATGARRRHWVGAFVADAIRPHVAGRFADMLRAVVTHPAMLVYLDQSVSVGPGSAAARRGAGLNENLARELLELHTLGVGGPYDQADVRQMAELLTGLGAEMQAGFVFRPERAEPGAETVLGRFYGSDGAARLSDVMAALDDLARHPATARHVATKLAVHFVADDPDPDLVGAIGETYRATDGDLLQATAALLDHPAAWSPERRKVRQPVEFVQAALRALDVPPRSLENLHPSAMVRHFARPLAVMGQPLAGPTGPDGWPERPEDWITPQGMAGRIAWAMASPTFFADALPDPRAFVPTALGRGAPREVVFAASAAETPVEAIGIVLSCPEFHRR